MVSFPDEIFYPNGIKIAIDKTRLLLALKNPYTMNAMTTKLLSTAFKLENSGTPAEPINHTSTRFWIQKPEEYTLYDAIGVLSQVFGQDFNWLGPVYRHPDIPGRMGLICPLPNVLIITLTPNSSSDEPQISQNLDIKYTMKRSQEKSKYSGLNTHYYTIQDTQNFDAYQVKNDLEPETDVYRSFRFEHMPLIVPISNIPNDKFFDKQWDMKFIRAGGEGTTAWDLATGSENVVICVLDSGCDLVHPDLKFASSGIKLDTMVGDGSPATPPNPLTNIGHGTAVAGIIAATINNSLAIAGVAGNCKILPLAFVAWSEEEIIRGINFATAFNAKVINMSFKMNNIPDTTAVEEALRIASANTLICAATGNLNSTTIDYPARSEYVMACGASDMTDNRQSPSSSIKWDPPLIGSNFGPEMSVVAPGIGIPTTDIVGPTGFSSEDFILGFSGTSAAVPHLSGLAGLIFSVYPDVSPDEARNIIERTADKVGTLPYAINSGHPNGKWNIEMGYGRINALRAVLVAASFNPDSPWYRELVLAGTMVLHDYETFTDDEEKTSVFSVSGIPTTFQLGPFQTHVDLPVWIDKVGGEVRGEVRLTLDWKNNSSIDVRYNIRLYEGTSEDTTDLDGEITGILNVPKDNTGNLSEKVMNTDENSPDFIKLDMTIKNNKRL
jgi:subtilisin family serine protease